MASLTAQAALVALFLPLLALASACPDIPHLLAALDRSPASAPLPQRLSSPSSFLPVSRIRSYLPWWHESPPEADPSVLHVVSQLEDASGRGCYQAYAPLGDIYIWGLHGVPSNSSKALEYYEASAQFLGDPASQTMAGFIHSIGDWLSLGPQDPLKSSQANALLYYTFASLSGFPEAEMTLAYRYRAGIATPQSCQDALPLYKHLADQAMNTFNQGPPGGRHLPVPKSSIAQRNGGIYGRGASVAARSHAGSRFRPTYSEWIDYLEYYHANAKHGDPAAIFRLGLLYYDGVVSTTPTSNDGLRHEYPRALKWFTRLSRTVWPRDPQPALRPGGVYLPEKDIKLKTESNQSLLAGLAASFLGRMYLRGEGVPQDLQKAALWFNRGISESDRESHNFLGIMFRDGLAVRQDLHKALSHFQAAANARLPDAFVNLGKMSLSINDPQRASTYFEQAIRHGDTFQAFYYLAEIHSNAPNSEQDLCNVAASYYKTAAERGDWGNVAWTEAEEAWANGDRERSLLKYWLVAERGYEVAQENVAYILDSEKAWLQFGAGSTSRFRRELADKLALVFWTRSAAQENVDSLVKLGDYYLKGLGTPHHTPHPGKAAACYQSAASTQISALAMHNLGWMHENGFGVEKDFYLAKRFYDLSLETDSQAYLPVTLSLTKLHLRSLFNSVTGSDIESLAIFGNDRNREHGDDQHSTDGDLSSFSSTTALEFLKRLPRDIWKSVVVVKNDALRVWRGGGTDDNGSNPRMRYKSSIARDGGSDATDYTDYTNWNRHGSADEDEVLYADDEEDTDDLLDTIIFMVLCLVFGWLVYYRQVRQEAARVENQRVQQRVLDEWRDLANQRNNEPATNNISSGDNNPSASTQSQETDPARTTEQQPNLPVPSSTSSPSQPAVVQSNTDETPRLSTERNDNTFSSEEFSGAITSTATTQPSPVDPATSSTYLPASSSSSIPQESDNPSSSMPQESDNPSSSTSSSAPSVSPSTPRKEHGANSSANS